MQGSRSRKDGLQTPGLRLCKTPAAKGSAFMACARRHHQPLSTDLPRISAQNRTRHVFIVFCIVSLVLTDPARGGPELRFPAKRKQRPARRPRRTSSAQSSPPEVYPLEGLVEVAPWLLEVRIPWISGTLQMPGKNEWQRSFSICMFCND